MSTASWQEKVGDGFVDRQAERTVAHAFGGIGFAAVLIWLLVSFRNVDRSTYATEATRGTETAVSVRQPTVATTSTPMEATPPTSAEDLERELSDAIAMFTEPSQSARQPTESQSPQTTTSPTKASADTADHVGQLGTRIVAGETAPLYCFQSANAQTYLDIAQQFGGEFVVYEDKAAVRIGKSLTPEKHHVKPIDASWYFLFAERMAPLPKNLSRTTVAKVRALWPSLGTNAKVALSLPHEVDQAIFKEQKRWFRKAERPMDVNAITEGSLVGSRRFPSFRIATVDGK